MQLRTILDLKRFMNNWPGVFDELNFRDATEEYYVTTLINNMALFHDWNIDEGGGELRMELRGEIVKGSPGASVRIFKDGTIYVQINERPLSEKELQLKGIMDVSPKRIDVEQITRSVMYMGLASDDMSDFGVKKYADLCKKVLEINKDNAFVYSDLGLVDRMELFKLPVEKVRDCLIVPYDNGSDLIYEQNPSWSWECLKNLCESRKRDPEYPLVAYNAMTHTKSSLPQYILDCVNRTDEYCEFEKANREYGPERTLFRWILSKTEPVPTPQRFPIVSRVWVDENLRLREDDFPEFNSYSGDFKDMERRFFNNMKQCVRQKEKRR